MKTFFRRHPLPISASIIFALALLVRLWGISETGGTWDEDIYYNSAYHYYFNLKNGDFSQTSWGWNFEHPPVAKYLYLPASFLSQKLPPHPHFRQGVNLLPLRVVSATLGALACAVVVFFGALVFGNFAGGLFGGLILALLPQFVAYGKLASLESPQTLFLSLFFFFFSLAFSSKKGKTAPLLLSALAFALAFATRYSSGLALGVVGGALGIPALWQRDKKTLGQALVIPIAFGVGALLLLLIIWPWLWHRPVWAFIKSFTFSDQHFHRKDWQPFYYFTHLFFTTPLAITTLAVWGGWRSWREGKQIPLLTIFLWIIGFGGQGLLGLKGGGVRYSLMALPAIALLAGLGLARVANERKKQILAGAIIGAYLLINNATVYPYLMDYYGEGAGLVWGASRLGLGFGFRGEGIKRTVDWINANASPNSKIAFIVTPDEVPPLRSDLQRQANPDKETCYLVGLPPYKAVAGKEWEKVYEERVAKTVPLTVVYRKKTCQQSTQTDR